MNKKDPAKIEETPSAAETYRQAVQESTERAIATVKPHYYGKVDGVHVFHGTHEAHQSLVGIHLDHATDSDLEGALSEATQKGFRSIVLHGAPPESLRTRIHPELGAMIPGKVRKSEVAHQPLAKAFLQPDGATRTDAQTHTLALQSLPPDLMKWGAEKLSSLARDAVESFEISGKLLKVRKLDADLYSGWIESAGNVDHSFERLTLPELLSQVQSKLELYGKEPQAVMQTKIGEKLKEFRDKVRNQLAQESSATQDQPTQDELQENQTYQEASLEEKQELLFQELNELEQHLKEFSARFEAKFGAMPKEEVVTISGKELVQGLLNPEKVCPACENPVGKCSCYTGLPHPDFVFDGKRVMLFFKSENWDEEARSSFAEDFKRRAGRLLLKKLS